MDEVLPVLVFAATGVMNTLWGVRLLRGNGDSPFQPARKVLTETQRRRAGWAFVVAGVSAGGYAVTPRPFSLLLGGLFLTGLVTAGVLSLRGAAPGAGGEPKELEEVP